MTRFACPYLEGEVEWTLEREAHIAENHPDLLPEHRDLIAGTLAEPDEVRPSRRFGSAKLFSRWYPGLKRGKYVVIVVVSDPSPRGRHWIVTAYITRRLAQGDPEWKRH
jgi:hypothetical protein